MVRRSQPVDSIEGLRAEIASLLVNFGKELKKSDLRPKVIALVPVFHKLRDLGASLITDADGANARDRILAYLRRYPKRVIAGDELMVVSGIGEWARRLRELRVEDGWNICSGNTFRELYEDDPAEASEVEKIFGVSPLAISPDEYVLVEEEPDRDAAHRWIILNRIRKEPTSVQDKLLKFFQANVGQRVTGEELRYLAKDAKEWARRVRELRTEQGWQIRTKASGRPDLAVGVYVLERDQQAPPHDRKISDSDRVEVLVRDRYRCTSCGWKREMLANGDPRAFLELHHLVEHSRGGKNTVANLVTLCNVHHDEVHAKRLKWNGSLRRWEKVSR